MVSSCITQDHVFSSESLALYFAVKTQGKIFNKTGDDRDLCVPLLLRCLRNLLRFL